VDEAMRVTVHVQDWRGHPVSDGQITGSIEGFDDLPPGLPGAAARGGREGRYRLAVRCPSAGPQQLLIGDGVSGRTQTFPVVFRPGKAASVKITQQPLEAVAAPRRQARLSLAARDRFGNLLETPEVKWSASGGKVRPVHPQENESADALVAFPSGRLVRVTASVGNRSASQHIDNPDVLLLSTAPNNAPVSDATFSPGPAPVVFPGDRFRMALIAIAPPGGGVLRGYRVRLQEPVGMVERLGFHLTNADNGLPQPTISHLGRGTIELTTTELAVSIPDDGGGIYLGELLYACAGSGRTCFEVTEAELTISRSPDEEYQLNAGVRMCPVQKARAEKGLCLNICIAAAPKAGKTAEEVFNAIKAQVEADVQSAQGILDANIAICCPKIRITTHFHEIPWARYQAIVAGGGKPGEMEVLPGPWETVNDSQDAAANIWEPNDKLKNLPLRLLRADHQAQKGPSLEEARWRRHQPPGLSGHDFGCGIRTGDRAAPGAARQQQLADPRARAHAHRSAAQQQRWHRARTEYQCRPGHAPEPPARRQVHPGGVQPDLR
jgi:hypothetical protein